MSWTAERLDALPEGTLITWTEDSYPEAAVRGDRSWRLLSGPEVFSEGVIEDADPGSISVVSVPTDALLGFDAVVAAVDARLHGDMKAAIRAAIAHVTGEAS